MLVTSCVLSLLLKSKLVKFERKKERLTLENDRCDKEDRYETNGVRARPSNHRLFNKWAQLGETDSGETNHCILPHATQFWR